MANLIDLCVHQEDYNVYKGIKFTEFCNKYKDKLEALRTIYSVCSSYGFYCPTIYRNKINSNVVVKYETEEGKSFFFIIKDDLIKYEYSHLKYESVINNNAVSRGVCRLISQI